MAEYVVFDLESSPHAVDLIVVELIQCGPLGVDYLVIRLRVTTISTSRTARKFGPYALLVAWGGLVGATCRGFMRALSCPTYHEKSKGRGVV